VLIDAWRRLYGFPWGLLLKHGSGRRWGFGLELVGAVRENRLARGWKPEARRLEYGWKLEEPHQQNLAKSRAPVTVTRELALCGAGAQTRSAWEHV
jgi:hypothetical protein